MTRRHNDNTESTEAETTDELLSEDEFADMGWPGDIAKVNSGADRVHMIAGSLADTGVLEIEEAQVFAFHEIAGVGPQRIADETNMFTSEIGSKLRLAKRKVDDARELVEILDDCNC